MAAYGGRFAAIMGAQYKHALKDANPNLIPLYDADVPGNPVFNFLIVGLPDEHAGGEYLFEVKAKDSFPQTAPAFEVLTPNGLYEPGGPICISIGEFHQDDRASKDGSSGWRPVLGIGGFAREVLNGLIVPDSMGGGIRIVAPEKRNKALTRKCAEASVAYNAAKYPKLMQAVDEFVAQHPDVPAVQALLRGRAVVALKGLGAPRWETYASYAPDALGKEAWAELAPAVYSAEDAPSPAMWALAVGAAAAPNEAARLALATLIAARLAPSAGFEKAAASRVIEAVGESVSVSLRGALGRVLEAGGVQLAEVHDAVSRLLEADDPDARRAAATALAGLLASAQRNAPAPQIAAHSRASAPPRVPVHVQPPAPAPAKVAPAPAPAPPAPAKVAPAPAPAAQVAQAPPAPVPAAPAPAIDDMDDYLAQLGLD